MRLGKFSLLLAWALLQAIAPLLHAHVGELKFAGAVHLSIASHGSEQQPGAEPALAALERSPVVECANASKHDGFAALEGNDHYLLSAWPSAAQSHRARTSPTCSRGDIASGRPHPYAHPQSLAPPFRLLG